MFDFRIIIYADGMEIIDRSLKTPYDALTLVQMIEYIETDKQMAIMDSIRKKRQKKEKRKQKRESNLLWRLACFCGLV